MKRQTLFNIHFYLSSFFTPFLLLIAITGTCYLFGEKGSLDKKMIEGFVVLDEDIDKQKQITNLLNKIDKSYHFETIKDRGSAIQTRPTTRRYFELIKKEEGQYSLYSVNPNFLSRIIEVHKGHGPSLLKTLQKVLGISLVLIIITGLFMSMQISKRAKPFLITMGLGTLALLSLFFL